MLRLVQNQRERVRVRFREERSHDGDPKARFFASLRMTCLNCIPSEVTSVYGGQRGRRYNAGLITRLWRWSRSERRCRRTASRAFHLRSTSALSGAGSKRTEIAQAVEVAATRAAPRERAGCKKLVDGTELYAAGAGSGGAGNGGAGSKRRGMAGVAAVHTRALAIIYFRRFFMDSAKTVNHKHDDGVGLDLFMVLGPPRCSGFPTAWTRSASG